MISPPDAAAQGDIGLDNLSYSVRIGDSCIPGDDFVAVNHAGDRNVCVTGGYVPIRTASLCEELGGEFDATFGICAGVGAVIPCAQATTSWEYEFTPGYCVDPGFRANPTIDIGMQPVCIEDAIVQTSEAAASLSVGDRFYDNGTNYLIAEGAPSCSFGCIDGFDVNCDNRIGDFCAVELDRRAVRDVGTCIAARTESVPALPVAAVAAAPAAAIQSTTVLAHTGGDLDAADLGLALVGLGSLALAGRGRLRKRDEA